MRSAFAAESTGPQPARSRRRCKQDVVNPFHALTPPGFPALLSHGSSLPVSDAPQTGHWASRAGPQAGSLPARTRRCCEGPGGKSRARVCARRHRGAREVVCFVELLSHPKLTLEDSCPRALQRVCAHFYQNTAALPKGEGILNGQSSTAAPTPAPGCANGPHLNTRPGEDTEALELGSFSDTCHSWWPCTWRSVAQLTDSKGSPSSLRTCWHVKCSDEVSAFPVLGYANFSEDFINNCI